MFRKAGYDPTQAARIWELLTAEAEAGDWPSPPPLFASHPPTLERRETLAGLAEEASDAPSSAYEERYQNTILQFRFDWLREDLRTRNFSGSEHLYDRLVEAGHGRGETLFFKGEIYRLRDDRDAPPEVFRSLAFVEWSRGRRAEARQAFERYLEFAPSANDRLMIEFHIEELS
jgi:hypothetical protein